MPAPLPQPYPAVFAANHRGSLGLAAPRSLSKGFCGLLERRHARAVRPAEATLTTSAGWGDCRVMSHFESVSAAQYTAWQSSHRGRPAECDRSPQSTQIPAR